MPTSGQNEAFSSEKRALFYKMLKNKGISPIQAYEIPRRDQGQPIPLSFSQEWLWFFTEVKIDSPYYTILNSLHLRGPFEREVFARSLNELLQRHEVLRTTFYIQAGVPFQRIQEEQRITVACRDLRSLPGEAREQEVQRQMQAEVLQPFLLDQGPLIRATVLQLEENDHVLLLSLHHLISDGWSRGVLARELSAIYSAFLQGQPSPFAPLPFQYADYAVWQRNWLRGELYEQQMAYWHQQLAGAQTVLRLPAEHSRPLEPDPSENYRAFQCSAELRAKLLALGVKHEATLFMTLLAAFQTMLSLYTGQRNLVVFTRVAHRNRAELQGLIGCFFKMLALATDLSGDPGFSEILCRVRDVCKGAYAHQDAPFSEVLRMLRGAERDELEPQVQVIFELVNFPKLEIDLPGLTNTFLPRGLPTGHGPAYLDLTIVDTEEGLSGKCEYNSDVFRPSDIDERIFCFLALLERAVENPEGHCFP